MGYTRNMHPVAARKILAYDMVGRNTLNLPSRNGMQACVLDSSGTGLVA
jgi:hypothetical protein